MAKGKGSKLLQREAFAIARKLGADIKSGSKHQRAIIEKDNKIITQFGIRNGRDSKHGHIPPSLKVSQSIAYGLATCTVTSHEYFDILKKKGFLPS